MPRLATRSRNPRAVRGVINAQRLLLVAEPFLLIEGTLQRQDGVVLSPRRAPLAPRGRRGGRGLPRFSLDSSLARPRAGLSPPLPGSPPTDR